MSLMSYISFPFTHFISFHDHFMIDSMAFAPHLCAIGTDFDDGDGSSQARCTSQASRLNTGPGLRPR